MGRTMTVRRESYGAESEGNPPQAVRQRVGGTKVAKAKSERVLTELLDLEEVARHLSTSPRHIRRMVFERRIPYVKVGRFVRFVAADLARWLDEQRVGP
jgi:excisionase family DNA binding protein